MRNPSRRNVSISVHHKGIKGTTFVQNVRDFGFLHPSADARSNALKQRLEETIVDPRDWPAPDGGTTSKGHDDHTHRPDHPALCPHCGAALRYVGRIARMRPGMLPLVYQRGPPTRKEGSRDERKTAHTD